MSSWRRALFVVVCSVLIVSSSTVSALLGVSDPQRLWTLGSVPFSLDPASGFTAAERTTIMNAMALFGPVGTHTINLPIGHLTQDIISFRPKNDSDRDFIVFTRDVGTCSFDSNKAGKKGGLHIIKLNFTQCNNSAIIAHEIGHALGLYHEEQRQDRDRFVSIIWAGIPLNQRNNQQIQSDAVDIGPYDFGSLMHSPGATRTAVIISPNKPNNSINNSGSLTPTDIMGLRLLYRLNESTDPSMPTVKSHRLVTTTIRRIVSELDIQRPGRDPCKDKLLYDADMRFHLGRTTTGVPTSQNGEFNSIQKTGSLTNVHWGVMGYVPPAETDITLEIRASRDVPLDVGVVDNDCAPGPIDINPGRSSLNLQPGQPDPCSTFLILFINLESGDISRQKCGGSTEPVGRFGERLIFKGTEGPHPSLIELSLGIRSELNP